MGFVWVLSGWVVWGVVLGLCGGVGFALVGWFSWVGCLVYLVGLCMFFFGGWVFATLVFIALALFVYFVCVFVWGVLYLFFGVCSCGFVLCSVIVCVVISFCCVVLASLGWVGALLCLFGFGYFWFVRCLSFILFGLELSGVLLLLFII